MSIVPQFVYLAVMQKIQSQEGKGNKLTPLELRQFSINKNWRCWTIYWYLKSKNMVLEFPWVHEIFPQKFSPRKGNISWHPRSHDLTPKDFFLWRYVKSRIYDSNQGSSGLIEKNIPQETTAITVTKYRVRRSQWCHKTYLIKYTKNLFWRKNGVYNEVKYYNNNKKNPLWQIIVRFTLTPICEDIFKFSYINMYFCIFNYPPIQGLRGNGYYFQYIIFSSTGPILKQSRTCNYSNRRNHFNKLLTWNFMNNFCNFSHWWIQVKFIIPVLIY